MKNFLAAWQKLLQAIKTYVLSDYVKKLVVSYAVKALGASKGLAPWLVGMIVKKLWDYVENTVQKEIIAAKVKEENEKDKTDYETIINAPSATAEDIQNAAPIFIGGTIIKRT